MLWKTNARGALQMAFGGEVAVTAAGDGWPLTAGLKGCAAAKAAAAAAVAVPAPASIAAATDEGASDEGVIRTPLAVQSSMCQSR